MKSLTELTDDMLCVMIAEDQGWKKESRAAMGYGGVTAAIQYYWHRNGAIGFFPDYTSDLNAMHEIETRMDTDSYLDFTAVLVRVVERTEKIPYPSMSVRATARQRAEAYAITKGLALS